jgi:hypothetical protein
MSTTFATYELARAHAQKQADQPPHHSYGIERNTSGICEPWRVFLLPRPRNRYGHELRCEVVDPSDHSKVQK